MNNIYGGTSVSNGQPVTIPQNVNSFVIINLGISGLGVSFENTSITTYVVGGTQQGTQVNTFSIPATVKSFSPPGDTQPLLNSSEIVVTPGASSQVFVSWTL